MNSNPADGIPALTDEDRTLFTELTDILVPGDGVMPSAREIDIAHRWLDRALQTRPDMYAALRTILEAVAARPAEDRGKVIDELAVTHHDDFETFGKLISGAYFLDPRVREAIGYPGQEARPLVDDTGDYLDLLEHVVDRGPIFRPTP
ncbi:hypothetical protein ACWDO0_02885 [Nocardia rhamnosiphila]